MSKELEYTSRPWRGSRKLHGKRNSLMSLDKPQGKVLIFTRCCESGKLSLTLAMKSKSNSIQGNWTYLESIPSQLREEVKEHILSPLSKLWWMVHPMHQLGPGCTACPSSPMSQMERMGKLCS